MNENKKKSKGERKTIKERLIIFRKSKRPMNSFKTIILTFLIFAFFLLIGFDIISFASKDTIYTSPKKDDEFKLTFTGDVSPSRYLKDISEKKGHDIFYKDIKDIWDDSDLTLINLEASTLSKEVTEYNKSIKPSNIHLDVVEEDIEAIKSSGIDLIGYANNHSKDYGVQGFLDSLSIFDKLDMDYVGAGNNIYEATAPYIKEHEGKKISLWAVTDVVPKDFTARNNIPGVNGTNYLQSDFELNKVIKKSDYTIVYIHWGTEYALKPDEEIRELGRKYIDMGADLVIGAHPHVLLPVEKYKDGAIVYSMGNLVFDQTNGRTNEGTVASLYLSDSSKYLEFIPVEIDKGIPYKTSNTTVIKRIFNTLTKELEEEDYTIEKGVLKIKL